MNQKGLLFGGGFLGRRLAAAYGIPIAEGDICNPAEVCAALEQYGPAYCINAAGATGRPNIDACEATTQAMFRTSMSNGVGPGILVSECKKFGVFLVHLSSGSVFEATPPVDGGFTEETIPELAARMSWYALTKRMGEVSLSGFEALVIRFHMPLDERLHGRNLLTRMAGYPSVLDVSNTIVAVPDLMVALEQLIERRVRGTIHVVNPEPIRNARIMELYREYCDPAHNFTVVQPQPDSRPPVVLSIAKLRSLGITMRPTEEAVLDCVKRYR